MVTGWRASEGRVSEFDYDSNEIGSQGGVLPGLRSIAIAAFWS